MFSHVFNMCIHQVCSPVLFSPVQTAFLFELLYYDQICIGTFLANPITNAHCTAFFDCVQAFSNPQNAFSLALVCEFLYLERKKTVDIEL